MYQIDFIISAVLFIAALAIFTELVNIWIRK